MLLKFGEAFIYIYIILKRYIFFGFVVSFQILRAITIETGKHLECSSTLVLNEGQNYYIPNECASFKTCLPCQRFPSIANCDHPFNFRPSPFMKRNNEAAGVTAGRVINVPLAFNN